MRWIVMYFHLIKLLEILHRWRHMCSAVRASDATWWLMDAQDMCGAFLDRKLNFFSLFTQLQFPINQHSIGRGRGLLVWRKSSEKQ